MGFVIAVAGAAVPMPNPLIGVPSRIGTLFEVLYVGLVSVPDAQVIFNVDHLLTPLDHGGSNSVPIANILTPFYLMGVGCDHPGRPPGETDAVVGTFNDDTSTSPAGPCVNNILGCGLSANCIVTSVLNC